MNDSKTSIYLVLLAALTFSGCQTTKTIPQEISQKSYRIKEINRRLYDHMQILLAFSQQEDCDLELSNKAIDGVFLIVGRPDSHEMLLAKCLEEKDINSLISASVDLKKEKAQLLKEVEQHQKDLTKDYYNYSESHAIVQFIKYICAVLCFLILIVGILFFKSKLV